MKAVRGVVAADPLGRTLAILMLALGTASFAVFTGSAALVRADFHVQYQAAEHARLIIGVDPSFGQAVVEQVAGLPGLAAVEPRAVVHGEVRTESGSWVPLELTAVEDLGSWRMGRSLVESGSSTPGAGEILLDESTVEQLGLGVGDRAPFRDAAGRVVDLRIVGLSRQPGRAAWFDGPAFGVTTYQALASVLLVDGWNHLAVMPTDPEWPRGFPVNDPLLQSIVNQLVADGLEPGGIQVATDPGGTSLDRTLDGIDQVLVSAGGLGLLSGSLLVAGAVHGELRRRRRQLGVLQALGAGPGQLFRIGVAASARTVIPGVALGLMGGYAGALAMAAYVDGLINVRPETVVLPLGILAVQVLAALAVSGLAITLVVWRASRSPAATNLAERGVDPARSPFVLTAMAGLTRSPVRRMMIRNALRRGLSALLVVTSLAIAGGLFLAVTSVAAGLSAVQADEGAAVAGYRILSWFMGAVAALIGVIGGLGLVTSLSAVVVERRRELGVLAAIGASPPRLAALLAGEAVASAFLAWLGALILWPILAVPLGTQVGEALTGVGVMPAYGFEAALLLAGFVVIGLAASGVPTLRISRLHVARSLGYE